MNSKELKGSTVFINSIDNNTKNENLINDLKLYLSKNGVLVII